MRLPFLKDKKEQSEYYLALLLTDEKVNAVILEAFLGKLKIIATSEASFSASIEEVSPEEFINVADKAISKAEEILPPDIETHKAVFGVKESWIEEETKKISKEYLTKLKKMCDALDLSPVGFMVTTEAISHLLQEEEGAPLSAILVEVGKKQLTLKLLRGGKVAETIKGTLEESLPASVDLLLRHFTVPVLPARLILTSSTTADELSQQLTTHQWSKSLPFLHSPQITLLPEGFDIKAVTFGAATQMGFAFTPESLPKNLEEVHDTEINPIELNETMEAPKDEDNEDVEPPVHPASPEVESDTNFGFVVNQDIPEKKPPMVNHKHKEETASNPSASSGHGAAQAKETEGTEETASNAAHAEEPEGAEARQRVNGLSLLSRLSPFLTPLKGLRMPKLGNLPISGGVLKFIIPLVTVLLLIGGIILFYLFQVKTRVELTAQPKEVDRTETVVFSTTSASDFSKNIVAAKNVTTTVDGQVSTNATGKKEVGEKAKGGITFYNSTTKEQIITKGTTVTAKNLQFSLDDTVKIASSGGASDGAKTAKGNVTAKELGKEFNLPSGTKFAISGFSTSEAEGKNDSAFSGGSKEEITAVSKEDLAKLRKDLTKNLEDKARESLSQKTSGEETVLPLLTDSELSKTKFDKNVGDEAKKVTLSASVSFNGIAYQNDELEAFAKSRLKSHYSDDISFADKSMKQTIKDPKQKDEKSISAKVIITAGLLPKIDTGEVAEKLKGKSLTQAKEILAEIPQLSESKIVFSPNIPLLPNLFPLPNNIKVVMKHE